MVGRLADIRHDARMYWLGWRTQFKGATKLRGAFVLQIIGMIVNNLGLLTAWWFLFDRFGTINGWSGADLIGMQGVNMIVFGVVAVFSSGLFELPRYVDQGTFDTFLTKPSALLPQITSSAIEVASFGDLLLGVVLIGWYMLHVSVGLLAILLFGLMVATGIIILWCFTLLPFLLSFYMFDSDKVARNIVFFFNDVGMYPSGVLSGPVRTILLTVFPGLFVGAIPLDVLRGIGWEYVLFGFIVATFWLFVSLKFFRRAVCRYESANLVGAR